MFRLLRLHADKLILLPLLGMVIAGIISLAMHTTVFPDGGSPPSAKHHAAR
jgi:hypothetical protein